MKAISVRFSYYLLLLYFFKPVNEFEEKYKANYPGQIKNYCKHTFIFKNY